MQGKYIVNRALPGIVRKICDKYAIDCMAFSGDWVLRLQKGEATKWIVGYTFDINSAGSMQVSNDKVACYQVLRAESLPAIEHYLVRSRALTHYLEPPITAGKIVVKPLSSSSGIGVMPFDTVDEAERYVMEQPIGDYALCPRYDVVSEQRYFVLDSKIVLVYEKTCPGNNHNLPMFNLGQGAIARIVTPTPQFARLALGAQRATGLRLCAVDIITLRDGSHKIMEINSGFMMEHFARQSKEYYQKTFEVYETIITTMMS